MEQTYQQLFTLFKENPKEYDKAKLKLYPEYNDPEFVQKILAKKEFGRYLSTKPDNSLPYDTVANRLCTFKDFRLTPNQNFVSNFLSPYTPYNGLLLYHSVGVGKTASAISIAEKYYDAYRKRVLVILSGNIKDNFQKQIFDISKYSISSDQSQLVTGTKYPDMIFDKDPSKKELLEKRINKIIKERYQFIGYNKLVNIIERIKKHVERIERNPSKHEARIQEKLKETFSNRLIIIDEAHNLRMQSEVGDKKTSKTLMNLLQTAENTKLLLMTATPMFDDAREIVWLLNLLLTNDKKPNLKTSHLFDSKTGKLTVSGKAKLESITSNYISFMRGENPYTFPFRLFPSINKDPLVISHDKLPKVDFSGNSIVNGIKHLELYGSVMSDAQRSMYEKIKTKLPPKEQDTLSEEDDDLEDEDGHEDEAKMTNDIQKAVQISNVVYPSGIGKIGFTSVFGDNIPFRYNKNAEQVMAYDNLSTYSPKIKAIIDSIINSKGIVFVYSQYYYSGIYPLMAALEHVGFRKYNTSNSMVENAKIVNKFSHLPKPPSYIVISKNRDISPNNDAEIAMAKSIDNADGSIIKVIIVSKIGAEGIDFKRIREVHLLEPWFNLNRIEQIIGRAVRTCSHIDMPKEQRNVTIYMHANQYDTKNSEESIDLRMYRISENKQSRIAEVERIFKESAVDCFLNQDILNMSKDKLNTSFNIETSRGNIIPKYKIGDQDGTFLCGFQKCNIKCRASIPVSELGQDKESYDPIFIANEVDLYKRYVQQLFKNDIKAYTFQEITAILKSMYSSIDEEITSYALDELVDLKLEFQDSSGMTGYIIYRGNKYIFQGQHDIRATMYERIKGRVRPGKIDIGVLASSLKSKAKSSPIKSVDSQKTNSADKPKKSKNNTVTNKNDDILSKVTMELESLKQLIEEKTSESIMIDAIIDSLNDNDTRELIKQVVDSMKKGKLDSPLLKTIAKSLVSTGCFIIGQDGHPSHMYNRFDGKVYSTSSFEPIGPLEIVKLGDSYKSLLKKVINEYPADIKGYIDSKKGESKFKVKDNPHTSGFVCAQYSDLKLEDLKRLTNCEKDKINKKNLCKLYEIKMRKDKTLLRPWLISPEAKSIKQKT